MDAVEFITDQGITIININKNLRHTDIKPIIDDLAANYSYKLRIWNLSGLTITSEEIYELANYSKLKLTGRSECAFVTNSDLAFGYCRVFLARREDGDCEINVFRELEQAKKWILK
jgi:hypothetical protein